MQRAVVLCYAALVQVGDSKIFVRLHASPLILMIHHTVARKIIEPFKQHYMSRKGT